MIKGEIVQEVIKRVSFYIWHGQRLKCIEEVVKITPYPSYPLGYKPLMEHTYSEGHMEQESESKERERVYDKLKKKYSDDMVRVRKVWDYV